MSKKDLADLYNLASDKSVTLKPTDKGGGIVLLDICRRRIDSLMTAHRIPVFQEILPAQ